MPKLVYYLHWRLNYIILIALVQSGMCVSSIAMRLPRLFFGFTIVDVFHFMCAMRGLYIWLSMLADCEIASV
jgi:hypothetical protein